MAISFTTVLGIVLVAASGAGLVVQNGMNASLGASVGNAFAGVVSFITGLIVITVYFLVDVYGVGTTAPAAAAIRSAPWWSWLGGAAGAFYICCAIIFAKPLGAGTLTAVSVAAQLLAAIVFDAGGLLGFQKRRVHWARLLGACLLVAGVVLMSVFRGDAVVAAGLPVNAVQEPVKGSAVKEQALVSSSRMNTDLSVKGADQHVVELSAASGAGSLPADWP